MLQRKHFTESQPSFTNQTRISRARRWRSGVPLENRGSRSHKVSARNLAASIWRHQMQEEFAVSAADGGSYWSRGDESEFQSQIESSSFSLSNALDMESSINSDFTRPQKNQRSSSKGYEEEEEDVIAFVRDLKSELNFERISRKRMEMVNFKLVRELAEAKLQVRSAMNRYETERKMTELMEELCEFLERGIEEEKDRANILHTKLRKLRADVEEERNMISMAKAWREEQVQMKLVAAKVAFEDKYSQLSALVADLERFLGSHDDENDDIELEKFIVSSPSSILRHIGAIFSHIREGSAIVMKNKDIMHNTDMINID